MTNTKSVGLGLIGLLGLCGSVHAQEPSVVEPSEGGESAPAPAVVEPKAAAPTAPMAPTKPESSANGDDGTRFRFGVSAGGGILTGGPYNFTYGGIDLRFGAQINDLIGVYAQPQLGYYTGSTGIFSAGGLLGGSVVVDFTPIDYFFVGVGAGWGILNNPAGPEAHFRIGAYPLMSRSDEGVRRKALMLGLDFRMHFISGYDTFIAPTFSIGYEAF